MLYNVYWTNRWMDGQINVVIVEWMDKWIDEYTNGGSMDGWMDKQL